MRELLYKNTAHAIEGKFDDVLRNLKNIKKSLIKDGYEKLNIEISKREDRAISIEIYGYKKQSFIKKLLKIN